MFRTSKMQRVKLELPINEEDRFLNEISAYSLLQIDNVKEPTFPFTIGDQTIVEEKNRLEGLIRKTDSLTSKLPKDNLILQLLKSEKAVTLPHEQIIELQSDSEGFLGEAEGMIRKYGMLKKFKFSSKGKISNKVSSLLKDNFIVLRKTKKTDYLVFLEGWVKKGSLTKFNEIIAESLQGNSIISPDEEALKEGRNILGIKMVILASHFSNFEDLLNNYGIARFDLESKSEEPQLSEINYLDTIENINLVSVKLHYMKKLLLDRLDVVKAKERIARSSVLAIIEGWAKEKNVKKLTSMLDKGRYDYNMSLENPKRGDADVPTALENPRFIKSFEIITTMFGYPRYGQIDPTPFLFVFFSIFFGIMFGDVLDGLILLVFSLLLFKGYGSKSENGRKLSQVLAAISVSSIFFGFLSGEFAGGVIKLPVIWFNGFDDPMLFLTVAIILGVSQLTLGLVIGLINDLLSKNLKKAIGSRLSWLFILYGSILVLLHYFYSYTNVLDLYAGLALFLSGLAFVLSTSFMEIIDLTRLISNVVSYSRLVAINMSHVGIAKAFALLASSLTESGLLGTMFAVFLLIIVHVFISFIESFVAFAHSLRLQFVEFFSKFFEPVNTAFKPISRRIKSG